MAFNAVQILGRLTRDPELKTTSNGNTLAKFGVATSRKYRGSDGTMKEETTFIDVLAWGKTAENIHHFFFKGKEIFIIGRLRFEKWVDKETGKNRNKLLVICEGFSFVGAKPQQSNSLAVPSPSQKTVPENWTQIPQEEPPF